MPAQAQHRCRLHALASQLRPASTAATVTVDSKQGLGVRATTQPPSFTPDQADECVAFFREHGYAVLVGAYSPDEVKFMNDLWDRSQAEEPHMYPHLPPPPVSLCRRAALADPHPRCR